MPAAELLFETSARDALSAFRQFGIDAAGMSAQEVKAARNRLLARHHPDRGGSLGAAQQINAAYEVLKNGAPALLEQPQHSDEWSAPGRDRGCGDGFDWDAPCPNGKPQPSQPTGRAGGWRGRPRTDIPQWAWAGCRGRLPSNTRIARNDFTDPNFVKKSMWELSNKSRREYILWGYDGTHFCGSLAVYGSPHIFDYMAMAMVEWQTKGESRGPCRAVFAVENGSKDLYLIYADGDYCGEAPATVAHNSFNSNPENDDQFMRQTLPRFLELRKAERQAAPMAAG